MIKLIAEIIVFIFFVVGLLYVEEKTDDDLAYMCLYGIVYVYITEKFILGLL